MTSFQEFKGDYIEICAFCKKRRKLYGKATKTDSIYDIRGYWKIEDIKTDCKEHKWINYRGKTK